MEMLEPQEMNEERKVLPAGTLLHGGRYRIDGFLSSGGFGNTYVATNMEFGEQVAIKEFFIRGTSKRGDGKNIVFEDDNDLEQFKRQSRTFRKEAHRLRQLHNDHIVSVYNLFEENGTIYYEMDFIKGESLDEHLKRTEKPFNEDEILSILDQMLDALSAVHAQGLLHLDIKPSNIMIDRTGNAKLIDFGASKQVEGNRTLSTSSILLCTPGYAPLELVDQNRKCFGPWTDLYALGATLYRLLTLQKPPTATERLENQKRLVFPPTISPQMQQLIEWMMNSRRDERPQNVDEVRGYLSKNFDLDDEGVSIAVMPETSQEEEEKPEEDEQSEVVVVYPGVPKPAVPQQDTPKPEFPNQDVQNPAVSKSAVPKPAVPKRPKSKSKNTWVLVLSILLGTLAGVLIIVILLLFVL